MSMDDLSDEELEKLWGFPRPSWFEFKKAQFWHWRHLKYRRMRRRFKRWMGRPEHPPSPPPWGM